MQIRRCFTSILVLVCTAVCGWSADADAALACYKSGDYKAAIPLLQAAATDPANAAAVRPALLSALVYEGRVDDAVNLELALAAELPNDPHAMTARG